MLKNVIKSVWIPKKQLALVFLLYLVLNYFFSIWAYAFLYEIYDGECESMILCFLKTYDYTFKVKLYLLHNINIQTRQTEELVVI